MKAVIADLDIWWRAFGRIEPDPGVVAQFTRLARERRLLLLGWIRQELLERLGDERQAVRMAAILAGFPEVVLLPEDHIAAASRVRRLRGSGLLLPTRAALLWAVAERCGAAIWSVDGRWRPWSTRGAPLYVAAAG